MINFKDEIVKIFDELLNKDEEVMSIDDIRKNIETPPNYEMGDYAFPVFQLAKVFRKSPKDIAEDLASKIENKYFDEVKTQNGYINFYLNRAEISNYILSEIKEKGEEFGRPGIGEGQNVVIDYSSPNIAKPFHIGHLRSTVIGDSIEKIYKFLGYDTYGYNHLGDYGTQFGMLIYAINDGNIAKEDIEKDPIPELLKLYVDINTRASEDEEIMNECRKCFAELENGNPEYVQMWEWIREVSLHEFQKVYDMLDIEFYKFQGESFYTDYMPAEIEQLKKSGKMVESDGALRVNLEKYNLPSPVVMKSNGSTMYITRDIATAAYRHRVHKPYKNIYVVGSQQILYFQQLKAVLKEMGYDWYDELIHIPFGMVSLKDGTLSTRKGRVVYLENVLKKAIDKVGEILDEREEEKGTKIENKDELAKQVGIGAVKFQELFNQRIKDYVFDWDQTLSFEGDTGPYVQYVHARISSLLEKGGFDINNEIDPSLLTEENEINLLRTIYNLTDTVIEAGEKFEPYLVTRYVIELAKQFNSYYNSTQIIVEDELLKNTRLMLVYSVKVVIKIALSLLGIEAPNKM